MKQIHTAKINIRFLIKIGLFVIAIAVIIGLAQYAYSFPAIKDAIAMATTVKPETFTELYFENHASLPMTIIYNQIYSFSFTIHNLENKDVNYQYEIYIDIQGNKVPIDADSIVIKNGDYKTISEKYTLVPPIQKAQVVVTLKNNNQSIDFWTEGTL